MGLSILKFTYAGDNDFDLNFALGYASKSTIDCYVAADVPFNVDFDWLTDSQVRIVPTDVEIGDEIVFTRTVDKTGLPVDLTRDGALTRENVETCVTHALYAQHELIDGRFGEVVDLSDAVYDAVNTAVETALSSFIFETVFKRDMVLHPALTSASTETYTSGDEYCAAEDVMVEVITPPSVTTEFLVYNGDTIVFSVTINSAGEETDRSTDDVELTSGSVRVDVTGSNYVSGADIWFVFPMKTNAIVDFETELSDYIATFEEGFNE